MFELMPQRFPKVHSPFKREENQNGEYVVYDEVSEGYEWVFDNDDVVAVEKLDGTNCAVSVEQTETGLDLEAWTRHGYEPFQKAEPYGQYAHRRIVRAVQNSKRRGYLDDLSEGVHYGESVGPDFQDNSHELDENLFIPFSWLADKCSYNSWGKYPKDFDTISGWFEEDLFSLFYSRMHGTDLETSSVSNGTFCEGIIFVQPEAKYTESGLQTETEEFQNGDSRQVGTGFAKLRRDMFDWFEGERH